MAFDACGTTKLEGDEIIKRLATYLNVEPIDLVVALKVCAKSVSVKETNEKTSETN